MAATLAGSLVSLTTIMIIALVIGLAWICHRRKKERSMHSNVPHSYQLHTCKEMMKNPAYSSTGSQDKVPSGVPKQTTLTSVGTDNTSQEGEDSRKTHSQSPSPLLCQTNPKDVPCITSPDQMSSTCHEDITGINNHPQKLEKFTSHYDDIVIIGHSQPQRPPLPPKNGGKSLQIQHKPHTRKVEYCSIIVGGGSLNK